MAVDGTNQIPTVKIYKYMFLRDCIHPVIEHIFETRKKYTYADVQALDRRVRAFDFGTLASEVGGNPHAKPTPQQGGGGGVEPSLAGMMQRQLVLCIKESGESLSISIE